MKEAICQWTEACEVYIAEDGERTLDFLYRREGCKSAPRPDLVLLDIQIPKLDGFDLLRIIKQNPDLRDIPVVIFSTSRRPEDVRQAYELRANAYVIKPNTLDPYLQAMNAIGKYWLTVASLPKTEGRV